MRAVSSLYCRAAIEDRHITRVLTWHSTVISMPLRDYWSNRVTTIQRSLSVYDSISSLLISTSTANSTCPRVAPHLLTPQTRISDQRHSDQTRPGRPVNGRASHLHSMSLASMPAASIASAVDDHALEDPVSAPTRVNSPLLSGRHRHRSNSAPSPLSIQHSG